MTKKMKSTGLSQSKFAKLLNVSQPYIHKLIHSGKIPADCLYPDGTIDGLKAMAALRDSVLPGGKIGQGDHETQISSFYETKAKHEALKIELSRLELGEKCGDLIRKDLVTALMVNAATACKQKLLAIPDAIAKDMLAAGDAEEIEAILTAQITEALDDFTIMLEVGMYALEKKRRKDTIVGNGEGSGRDGKALGEYHPKKKARRCNR